MDTVVNLTDVDAMIGNIISDVQLEQGCNVQWMQAHGLVTRSVAKQSEGKIPRWTDEETRYYLNNVGKMSYQEIADDLGRSKAGVLLHAKRSRLPAATRVAGYITAHQAGLLIGVDSHNVPAWIDCGVMPGEKLPFDGRTVRRISLVQFKMWLIRPTSWVYFNVKNIKNPSLRRLIELAQAKWGDEWLTTRQAADLLGYEATDIFRQIKIGKLPGYKPAMLGARNKNPAWNYWFVRRSHLAGLVIVKKKGGPGFAKDCWSARADAFLLRARAEGKTYEELGRMMKWSWKRVHYRLVVLKGKK